MNLCRTAYRGIRLPDALAWRGRCREQRLPSPSHGPEAAAAVPFPGVAGASRPAHLCTYLPLAVTPAPPAAVPCSRSPLPPTRPRPDGRSPPCLTRARKLATDPRPVPFPAPPRRRFRRHWRGAPFSVETAAAWGTRAGPRLTTPPIICSSIPPLRFHRRRRQRAAPAVRRHAVLGRPRAPSIPPVSPFPPSPSPLAIRIKRFPENFEDLCVRCFINEHPSFVANARTPKEPWICRQSSFLKFAHAQKR